MANKKKQREQELEKVAQIEKWWDQAENSRSDFDWKWFLYDLWVNGHHYAKWDRTTQQITTTVKDKGKPKIVINKVYQTLRSVRNFVLRNQPRAEVTPIGLTEEGIDQVIKLNKYLDYLHDKLRLRHKLKGTVWHALKYSVGFWQVLWDEAEKEIAINMVDPYDFYPDPDAQGPDDLRYAFLAVKRNVDEVIHDPKYSEYIKKNEIELKGDDKKAASNLKERLINFERANNTASPGSNKGNTTIVRECWYKEWNEEESKWDIYICALADKELIRPPEKTDLSRIPFFRLQSDVEPMKFYGHGWVKNLISPNKLLNRLQSQLAEYNDLMNRGKWISEKGAGVRVINNENGQIIEKKRGFEVTQLPITALSAAIYKQIEDAERYLEDLGGAHDASMGRIPTGARSGKALEALQVGDANNMSEIIENLEDFLEDVYEYVLSLAAKKYQFARQVVPISRATGERDFIRVIGAGAGNIPEDAVVIEPENAVDVKITSWLAETQEARRDVLKELYQLQAIDQETLLKGYAIGNVSEVMKQSRIEREEQRQAETEQQLQLANAQNQNNGADTPSQAGAMQANADLQRLLSGQQVEPPKDLGPEYLAYLDQFMGSQEFNTLPPEAQEMVVNLRNQTAGLIR